MIEPETIQSLIDKLNRITINEAEFRDIQIKAAELIRQLFPNDSATTVYQINTIGTFNKDLYKSISELRSILEAKLQTIVRADQLRQQIEKKAEGERQRVEEKRKIANEIKESEYTIQLQNDLAHAYDDLKNAYDKINGLSNIVAEYENEINFLKEKAKKRYVNHLLKDWGFWGVIVAICVLFLGAGFYWGSNKFDSEKFQLKEQRDLYKSKVDSLIRSTHTTNQNKEHSKIH